MTERYMKLPLVQKVMFPLLILGSVSGIIFVSNWANQPDYGVLYSDLEEADAAAVIEKLKDNKVKYEVRGDGRTIAISPTDIIPELRIQLAGDGIPKSGSMGFELIKEPKLGVTDEMQKALYLAAIQGELERTILTIDAVASTRVHITQPEKSVFSKKNIETTASVLLRIKVGAELDKKQIKGIANLVAGAVSGLKPENVNIVDTKGNLLTPKDEGEESLAVEATRLQYQKEVERGYVQRIEQMLARVIGPEKVIARVTADLDFSANERQEESYDPGGQVLRSERSIEEGTGTSARGGVPGVVSNLSNDQSLLAPQNASDDKSNRRESVKNYEVTRAVSKTSSPRGRLNKLSVAVLVDGVYEAPTPGVEGAATASSAAKVYKSLPADTMSRIESVVKSAVGYDSSRGDSVTVENVPFYTSDEDFTEILKSQQLTSTILYWLTQGSPFVFLLLFFLIIVKPLVKFLVTPTDAEVDLTRLLPTGIKELEVELDAERSKAQIPAFEPAVDLEQLEELIAENSRIVKENPHQAALLIRYWLNDGRM
jgi:flagellar M-ring protein FliF